jgi:hypothetical protein
MITASGSINYSSPSGTIRRPVAAGVRLIPASTCSASRSAHVSARPWSGSAQPGASRLPPPMPLMSTWDLNRIACAGRAPGPRPHPRFARFGSTFRRGPKSKAGRRTPHPRPQAPQVQVRALRHRPDCRPGMAPRRAVCMCGARRGCGSTQEECWTFYPAPRRRSCTTGPPAWRSAAHPRTHRGSHTARSPELLTW